VASEKIAVILHNGKGDFSYCVVKVERRKPRNLVVVLCRLAALGSGSDRSAANDARYACQN